MSTFVDVHVLTARLPGYNKVIILFVLVLRTSKKSTRSRVGLASTNTHLGFGLTFLEIRCIISFIRKSEVRILNPNPHFLKGSAVNLLFVRIVTRAGKANNNASRSVSLALMKATTYKSVVKKIIYSTSKKIKITLKYLFCYVKHL